MSGSREVLPARGWADLSSLVPPHAVVNAAAQTIQIVFIFGILPRFVAVHAHSLANAILDERRLDVQETGTGANTTLPPDPADLQRLRKNNWDR